MRHFIFEMALITWSRDTLPSWISFARCSRKVCVVMLDSLAILTLYRYGHSGKTSLIHSLAGELGLDIYVVSLSSKG